MMKQVKIKTLKIVNFKGIKHLEIDFTQKTDISGDNATGKTTVFDAFAWCLFGKNSLDAKDFEIKNTVDTSLNSSNHVVELLLDIDGNEIFLRRIYKEKWQKRRGSEELEFTGNETLFFYNSVPCQSGEYSRKISDIVDEQLFKQITNPLYFNLTMSWQNRRDTLIKMAGTITDSDVIGQNESFRQLIASIHGQKSLEEYKKEIAAKKTGLKKQLADIPARIDELNRSNPKLQDWTAIESEIEKKRLELAAINKEIEDIDFSFQNELKDIRIKQAKIQDAKIKMGTIESELKQKAYSDAQQANSDVNKAKSDLYIVRNELVSKKIRKEGSEVQISRLTNQIAKLRDNWTEENARTLVFDESKFLCHTCKREFEADSIEEKKAEMRKNFHSDQQKNLLEISASGKQKGVELAEYEKNLLSLNQEIEALQAKEKSLLYAENAVLATPKEIDLSGNAEYQALKIESEKVIEVKQPDITAQKESKRLIQEEIDVKKELLSGKTQIERNEIRITELMDEEKRYAQEMANLEKVEFTIDNFNKTKMNLVESAVNDKFKIVKFKLFKTLINGGEEPCCETMVNNVPFASLNHAMQINAGIDCINALSEQYGVTAPLFVDNAEAVNELIPTGSQLIRLVVTKDSDLAINNY